jgi:hypothetical protein
MNKGPERILPDPADCILERNGRMHVPDIPRIGNGETAFRVSQRFLEQRLI